MAEFGKLTERQQYRIEQEALDAVSAGQSYLDCPYPFGSFECRHWVACWILEGGVKDKDRLSQ